MILRVFFSALILSSLFLVNVSKAQYVITQESITLYNAEINQDEDSTASLPSYTRFLEIGVSSNAYKGDLHSKYHLWSSAINIGVKLNFKKRWNSHFELTVGSIRGQNYDYQFDSKTRPNRFFKNKFTAFNYDLQYNIVKQKNWLVYLSQGIGFMRFAIQDEEGEDFRDMQDTRAPNEVLNNFSAVLPTSIGAMYWFDNGYGAGTQLSFRNTTSDYLDNISQWGKRVGADNICSWKIFFVIPLSKLEHFEFIKEKDKVIGSYSDGYYYKQK